MSDIEKLLAVVFNETEAKALEAQVEADAAKEAARLGRRGPRGNSKRAQVARAMMTPEGITDSEIATIYGKRRSMTTAAKKLATLYRMTLLVLPVDGSKDRRYVLKAIDDDADDMPEVVLDDDDVDDDAGDDDLVSVTCRNAPFGIAA